MKKIFILTALLAGLLAQGVYGRSPASQNLFNEVLYSPPWADLYIYLNCDKIKKFLKRNGVGTDDLAFLLGSDGLQQYDNAAGQLMADNIEEMYIVTGTQYLKQDGPFLFFSQ